MENESNFYQIFTKFLSNFYLAGMKRRNTTRGPNKILSSFSDVCQNHNLLIFLSFLFSTYLCFVLIYEFFFFAFFPIFSVVLWRKPEMKRKKMRICWTFDLHLVIFFLLVMIWKKPFKENNRNKLTFGTFTFLNENTIKIFPSICEI